MTFYKTMIVTWSILFLAPPSSWAQSIVAAVLPSSRSVQLGAPSTSPPYYMAFATIINVGQQLATDCRISSLSSIPAIFSYADLETPPWDYGGPPIDIPAGAAHRFSFGFIPYGPMAPTDVQLSFKCANTEPAPIIPGVNTFLFSVSATPVADIVAMAVTLSNDGIVNIPGANGTGAFAVATVNVGVSGIITASAHTGSVTLPVNIFLCQTEPGTGQCTSVIDSTVMTTINANARPTFAIFVQGNGNVPFDPAGNRVFVQFTDSSGVNRGLTSVAVRTSDPCPPEACCGCWDY
jgi:hypothetical protein